MPFTVEDDLLRWKERSVSAWKQDWTSAFFITLHSLSVIVLGILFLLDVVQREGKYTLFPFDVTDGLGQLLSWVVIAALGLVWFLCGSLLAYPFATRLIQPISMSIVSDGAIRGQYFSPWHFYSHFSTEAACRLIRLYSRRTPEIARAAWQPPTESIFKQVVGLIGEHLPQEPPVKLPLSWYQRRIAFLGWLFILTVPLVVIGLLLYISTWRWTWMYYPVATYLIFILGGVIIQKYQVG
jgi:hypothetical protein